MAKNLTGTGIAFLVANEGIEQVEQTEPRQAAAAAGAAVDLVARSRAKRRRTEPTSLRFGARLADEAGQVGRSHMNTIEEDAWL